MTIKQIRLFFYYARLFGCRTVETSHGYLYSGLYVKNKFQTRLGDELRIQYGLRALNVDISLEEVFGYAFDSASLNGDEIVFTTIIVDTDVLTFGRFIE